MRKWIAVTWLILLAGIIFAFFWHNQLKYSLPTPIPADYKSVQNGKKIMLRQKLQFNNDKPVFLHFFNPDCPCSRFNIDQFKSLVKTYRSQVNFAVVLMTDKPYTSSDIQNKFGITVPIVADSTIAMSCGVYSTPQAVVLTAEKKLYYRGNYNKSRYCTDKKTSYANIALMNILHKNTTLRLDQYALKAYGCTLPNCVN
ncbi:redoxin domain-containing protein [Pedobacter sp. MC2016-15]|uniref:TlpA family protein disulfide reductase n=1 Tax=Pedobacter sp. MC2016-15 TaxID=2994473 RepID=UPI002246EA5D|nr:redoxin domain-containing protein [Pedobacter sp. MC2016-15]MCX2481430.1 redoxin domain-containing protein [Pedobacter sp. MC2016-15]